MENIWTQIPFSETSCSLCAGCCMVIRSRSCPAECLTAWPLWSCCKSEPQRAFICLNWHLHKGISGVNMIVISQFVGLKPSCLCSVLAKSKAGFMGSRWVHDADVVLCSSGCWMPTRSTASERQCSKIWRTWLCCRCMTTKSRVWRKAPSARCTASRPCERKHSHTHTILGSVPLHSVLIWLMSCPLWFPISHLAQNPFVCDCNVKWLADFLRSNPIETSGARCASPRRLANKRIAQIKSNKFRCSGQCVCVCVCACVCVIKQTR